MHGFFADSIHKAAIGKDRTTLSSYMELASTAVDNSLDHVNITSSIDQTAYNSLDQVLN